MLKLKVFTWSGQKSEVEDQFEQWLYELAAKNSVVIRQMQLAAAGGYDGPWTLLVCYALDPLPLGSGFSPGAVTFDKHW